jgi:DNA-binding transcriptional MerR regulator
VASLAALRATSSTKPVHVGDPRLASKATSDPSGIGSGLASSAPAVTGSRFRAGVDVGVKVYRCCMRIGELAEQAGTSTRTLRYYEQHGLLAARRTANGYRDYDDVDLRLVREIRSLLDLGFNLEETRPFVECLRSGRETGAECPASIEVLGRKLSDLDTCIARLRNARRRVSNELAVASGRPDPEVTSHDN